MAGGPGIFDVVSRRSAGRALAVAAVLAITLPATAGASLAIAAERPRPAVPFAVMLASQAVLVCGLVWGLVGVLRGRRGRGGVGASPEAVASAVDVTALAAGVLAADLLVVRLLGVGVPTEGVLLMGLRSVMVGLVVVFLGQVLARPGRGVGEAGYGSRVAAVACAAGPFILLSAASMCEGPPRALIVLMGVMGGVACLILRYVGRAAVGYGGGLRAVCLGVVFGVVSVTALTTAVVLGDAEDVRWFERGLTPTSGGVGRGSELARSGLGEGPDQVLGSDDPHSTGFDLGEIFVSSEEPTLYDAFTETFGEPRPPRDGHKLLALDSTRLKMSAARLEQDLRTGRTLAVRRQSRSGFRADRKREAEAVLLVKASGPQHLRMAIYDDYVGGHWYPGLLPWTVAPLRVMPVEGPERAEESAAPAPLQRRWLEFLDAPASRGLGGITEAQVRIGKLDGHTLPMGSNTVAFRLGLVDEVSWFRGSSKWLVKLAARPIPAGAVLELRSRPLDPRLRHRDLPSRHISPPVDEVEHCLRSWAMGVTSHTQDAWGQVDAIVSAVRQLGTYRGVVEQSGVRLGEPSTRPDATDEAGEVAGGDEEEDPVLRFVRHGGAASAVEYASTAALALRSLGYRTRLAGGFYADPKRVDPRSGLVPVTAADAHVWVEVATNDGAWVILEPTPTFLPPTPGFSLEGWLAGVMMAVRGVAWWVVSAAVLVWVGWRWRRAMCLAGLGMVGHVVLRCDFWLAGRPRQRVRWTLGLVELASRSAGRPRPAHQTRGRFAQALGLCELAHLAAWASYAPAGLTAPCADHELKRICIRAVCSVTRHRAWERSCST